MAGTSRRVWVAMAGLNWGPNGRTRHEPGDLITDLPAEFARWMPAQGLIREATPDERAAAGVPEPPTAPPAVTATQTPTGPAEEH